jgi:glycerate kinase
MKIVIAIDSFKGSLSSRDAGEAAARGVRVAAPHATVRVFELADGGEGTTDALLSATGGRKVTMSVTGPMGTPVTADYAILSDGTAVIEVAAAAGLPLVPPDERNPLIATTYGVGQQIANAIEKGVRRFIIGLGGSATNDGGVGMLAALGFRFLDGAGRDIPLGAQGLAALSKIETAASLPTLSECEFLVACDVDNPLCGARGASAVYGPQKGASVTDVAELDAMLARYASLTKDTLGNTAADTPGAGAAGGLGFAFLSYLSGRLVSGVDLVIAQAKMEDEMKDADLILTGEGRLDGQSAMGKAPVGIAKAAKKHGRTVVALAGCVTPDARACHEAGIDAFFPIPDRPMTLDEAMAAETARTNIERTAEEVTRLYLSACKK